MDELRVMNLDLRAPLLFRARKSSTLRVKDGGEAVAVYDGGDPSKTPLVPSIVADAVGGDSSGATVDGPPGNRVEIPAGRYLFVQTRAEADDRSIAALADELGNEALWRGLELSPRLFIRALSEEGGPVLQALKPILGESGGR